MKEIPLTRGKVALVDDEDYDELMKHKWFATLDRGRSYAARSVWVSDKKTNSILMHRAIWEMHNGPIPPKMQIDHIGGERLDNQKKNLRPCTRSQNLYNRRVVKNEQSTSKFKGVCYWEQRNKWAAKTKDHGRTINIGLFDTEEEAALAYNRKATELFGEYAYINKMEGILG